MQVSSPVSVHHRLFNPCSVSDFEDDFSFKLRLNDQEMAQKPSGDEAVEEEDEEFSFACLNPDGSPISAGDIFEDGQIRPLFPLFNVNEAKNSSEQLVRPPLKKLFVESDHHHTSSSSVSSFEPEGPYCAWESKAAVETSPEVCKKSNSTGFSKLRRFRELVLRSNSDGKDAFVFLNNNNNGITKTESSASTKTSSEAQKTKKAGNEKEKKKGKKAPETASSVHEKFYVRNRAIKEESKRKSYLPYRVGFFTNVNGLSRNIHPY